MSVVFCDSLCEMKVDIAGICTSVVTDDSCLIDKIKNGYDKFFSDRTADFKIKVSIEEDRDFFRSLRNGIYSLKDGIEVIDDYFLGHVDLVEGIAEARVLSEWSDLATTSFIKCLYIILVLKKRGLILHASVIEKHGKAYIFIGPSGCGKTTVASLSSGCTVINDDLTVIKATDDGYKVFPTPCWGHMQKGEITNTPYPIGGLFKLVKDNSVYLKNLPPTVAIAEIFSFLPAFDNFISPQNILDNYIELLNAVPFRELHFLQDASFWGKIEEELQV